MQYCISAVRLCSLLDYVEVLPINELFALLDNVDSISSKLNISLYIYIPIYDDTVVLGERIRTIYRVSLFAAITLVYGSFSVDVGSYSFYLDYPMDFMSR